jgi:hypothetical protein
MGFNPTLPVSGKLRNLNGQQVQMLERKSVSPLRESLQIPIQIASLIPNGVRLKLGEAKRDWPGEWAARRESLRNHGTTERAPTLSPRSEVAGRETERGVSHTEPNAALSRIRSLAFSMFNPVQSTRRALFSDHRQA